MNKRLFIWIVLLMGISLAGIVCVFYFWFNNPLKMNDELFDRQVNEALINAVQQIQRSQDIRIIDNGLNHDTLNWGSKTTIKSGSDNLQLKRKNRVKGSKDTTLNPPGLKQTTPRLNNAQKRKLQQLQMLTERLNSQYKDWASNRHIDLLKLKSIVKKELQANDIPLDFHYAIFSGDSILETDLKKVVNPKWYKVILFPDDIFNRDLFLGIYFPGKGVFINRIHAILPQLSVVIILLIIITYVMSILFIIRQKKLSILKTDFINNMTHEFKTPITTISIAVDSILNDEVIKDEDRVRFYSKIIGKENQRLNGQVERILQIAGPESKKLYFKVQDVNVHELIEEAIAGISLQIDKRGGRISTKFEAENPIIPTDPTHFTNLVHNLLDNANKYSPDAPEILVSTVNDHKGLYMTVEDKGIGMSKRGQSKIFERFYRLAPGNLQNIKGFGLGLSYTKAILKLNHGNIKVFSEPGKGSRFVVFIPYSTR
jgi:two-component system, OmpR family, phosphate regulon sensor histidine kinase PhoR